MAELIWNGPKVWKGPRELHATAGDREYRIRESWRVDLAGRAIKPVYEVSVAAAAARPGIAGESLGETATLTEAKAVAQCHAEAD
jgi:hypothetical protein